MGKQKGLTALQTVSPFNSRNYRLIHTAVTICDANRNDDEYGDEILS